MNNLILIFFALIFISCSSNDTTDLDLEQNIYENNLFKDYELFENANNHITNGDLDSALIELNKIDVLFPSSKYANKGMLLTAYIFFLKEDYEKTRALAESYKKYYPGSEDIVYANYLEAMTYYTLIKKPNYSQKNASQALIKFNFILNAYPNSIYEIDILTKIKILDNNLAANKIATAKYYLNKGNTNGSLIYLKDIFINHDSSLSIEECLYLLTKIYFGLDEPDLSRNYAAILAYNFPESIWYEKSYNIVNEIETVSNEEYWYKKFNPIKLFINNQKEENFEIQKID
ncbi:MAG: outer membrane protein assembly factor BamD [Alphaproteobacteria bacterium]|tara:strand:- start:377 stop:1243 length:867 start_codon:yes stop_codon:yes gene_type:complete